MMEPLPAEHPLRSADWLWPEAYLCLHNHYAQFRWDVELPEVFSVVPLFVTTDRIETVHDSVRRTDVDAEELDSARTGTDRI